MRKTVLVLASVALAMLLVSGVALAANVIQCTPNKNCLGTERPDILRGTPAPDIMYGYTPRRGDMNNLDHDTIYGFARNDRVFGGLGRDRLYGVGGSDHLYGDQGADKLVGGTGHDTIYGGPQADNISGGDGDDTLWVGHPGRPNELVERIEGGAGNDRVQGSWDDDALVGNGGADDVIGDRGVDHLYGGDGPDTINSADFDPWTDVNERDFVSCGGGFDTVTAEQGLDVIDADCEKVIPEAPFEG